MTERLRSEINFPLAVPAIFFAAGIAAGRHSQFTPTDLQVYSILASVVLLNLILVARPITYLRLTSIALAFFVVGYANINAAKLAPINEKLKTFTNSGRDAVLAGTVRTAPSFDGYRGKFIVDVDQLKSGDSDAGPVSLRILLKTPFPPPDLLVPGGRVLIRASLAIPALPGTPGSFDYRRYLTDRRIQLTGFIRSTAYLSSTVSAPAAYTTLSQFAYLPQHLRHRTNLFIDTVDLPPKIKGLFKALITGQRDSVPGKIIENFKRSGAIHLLAISGMHMGLLAILSALLFNTLLRRSLWLLLRWPTWKIAALLTLPVMAVYALISGLQPPVVRAFIMAAMLVAAIVFDRPRSLLNALALAGLLILFHDPTALFSVSFQLSFVAVAAIIISRKRLADLYRSAAPEQNISGLIKAWAFTGIAVSVIAMIATGPITLYNFHQISLLGPVTTLLTAPLLCFWSLPLGLSAALLSPWLPASAAAILKFASLGLYGADMVTATLAAVPFSFLNLPPPSLAALSLYYLLGAYLLLFKSPRTTQVILIMIMVSVINMPSHISFRDNDELTRISFLDVGQGSSTLLELPMGQKILVDGGGSSSPSFDPGEQLIAPFLWQRSINRLDALVISHQHQDHYNGLEFIIRNFRPLEVWINGSETESPEYKAILRAAEECGAALKIPEPDSLIAAGGEARVTTIGNLHLRNEADLSDNNLSLVVKLESGGRKVILPGDAMADDGRYLIKQGVDLTSDVLLAPHHGSSHSAGYQLVAAGTPEWLVVSAGPFQTGSYPDPEFAEWCRKRGTKLLDTATYGTMTFTIGKSSELNWQAISAKGRERLEYLHKLAESANSRITPR